MKKSLCFALLLVVFGAVSAPPPRTWAADDRAVAVEASPSDAEYALANAEEAGQAFPTDWTKDDICRDPDGYFEFVIAALLEERAANSPIVEDLEMSVDELTEQIDQKTQLLSNTRELAAEFGRLFRQAERDKSWPVEVCGKKYSKERLESQTCRLAVRAAAFKAAIEQLQDARERAEAGLETAEVRPTHLEAQIIITRMLQRLYRAQQIPSRGPEMLSRIQGLIADPAQPSDPDELLQALAACRPIKPIEGPRRDIASQYLGTGGRSKKRKPVAQQAQADTVPPIFLQK